MKKVGMLFSRIVKLLKCAKKDQEKSDLMLNHIRRKPNEPFRRHSDHCLLLWDARGGGGISENPILAI